MSKFQTRTKYPQFLRKQLSGFDNEAEVILLSPPVGNQSWRLEMVLPRVLMRIVKGLPGPGTC